MISLQKKLFSEEVHFSMDQFTPVKEISLHSTCKDILISNFVRKGWNFSKCSWTEMGLVETCPVCKDCPTPSPQHKKLEQFMYKVEIQTQWHINV